MNSLENKIWSRLFSLPQIIFIVDKNVASLYTIEKRDRDLLFLIDGEHDKNLDMLTYLLCTILDTPDLSRKVSLCAIGGGATLDLGGLLASLLFRGVDLFLIPTTLLAMVDASIGGKTAINYKFKNQIGTFYDAQDIFLDLNFLKTLPLAELNSGKGEIVKYAFLHKNILSFILQEELNNQGWEQLINLSINFKKEIVKQDPYDQNIRQSLNWGHTLGHIIERESHLSHGESIVQAIYIMLGLFAKHLSPIFNEVVTKLHLPFTAQSFDLKKFSTMLYSDKKEKFVLLYDIAQYRLEEMDILKEKLCRLNA